MKKRFYLLILLNSIVVFSQKTESQKLTIEQIIQKRLDKVTNFPIYKAIEYKDKAGISDLVFTENQKVISKKDTINTKIKAICFINDDGNLSEKWQINDLIEDYNTKETTIWFWTKYCSTKDIDGDGFIDPIIVYGTKTEDEEIRRVKIITVYNNKKYVIRATECVLDDCRTFKKDSNWNLLPQKIKTHIDQLIIRIRKGQNLILKDG